MEKTKKQAVVDPSQAFTYASGQIPSTYKCGECGKTHVKLWRDYNTFLEHQSLICAPCITEEYKAQGEERIFRKNSQNKERWSHPDGRPNEADNIGWRIPAVPTEDNDTFWGYTSVPEEGCIWWNNLAIGYES